MRVIKGDQLDTNTAQTPGMNRAAAINAARVGAQKIWAGTVTIHPNAKTGAHHHGALESVIYVVRGKARMRWGEQLEFVAEAGPGDFIFVPPYVPHQEINASTDEPLECVLVRSDNEAVVVNLDIDAVEAARNGVLGRSDSQASARSLTFVTRLMTPTVSLRPRLFTLYAVLIAANLGAWAWALIAFRHYPLLLGTALLAYGSACVMRSTPITSRRSTPSRAS